MTDRPEAHPAARRPRQRRRLHHRQVAQRHRRPARRHAHRRPACGSTRRTRTARASATTPTRTVADGQEISLHLVRRPRGRGAARRRRQPRHLRGRRRGGGADTSRIRRPEAEGPRVQRHPSIQRGLYGAVVVHPKGSTWHNQVDGPGPARPGSGRAVETQVFADVRNPPCPTSAPSRSSCSTRTRTSRTRTARCRPSRPPACEDSTFGFNYRAEPLRNRLRAILEHRAGRDGARCPAARSSSPRTTSATATTPSSDKVVDDPGAKCMSEESHLQSWVFGDEGKLVTRPADDRHRLDNLIPKAYKGDPVKYHVIHPGAKESHPFHQHTMRWYADPGNKKSSRNDVQLLGPGESRLLDIEGGAGSVTGTIGDSIFHCHLYPHFAQGFWGHLRIYDRKRDGTPEVPGRHGDRGAQGAARPRRPDARGPTRRTRASRCSSRATSASAPTARRSRSSRTTSRALRRKGDAPRTPTALEAANLPGAQRGKPGAAYVDPCPTGAPDAHLPAARHRRADHLQLGRLEGPRGPHVRRGGPDVAAVRAGTKQPEPYTIRARVGECVAGADDQRPAPRRRPDQADRPPEQEGRHVHGGDGDVGGLHPRAPRQVRRARLGRHLGGLELRPGGDAGADLRATAGSSTSRCARSSSTTTSTRTCTSRRACSRR